MDSLAGYIATICVGALGQYLSQFLRPKVKILYWLAHDFLYRIPTNALVPAQPPADNQRGTFNAGQTTAPAVPQTFFLLTQSVTIQNFGRERADWVEITYRQKPDFFQLQPPFNFAEMTSPTGEHTIRVASLAPKEWFTVQFLFYTHAPELLHIRSSAGIASVMPWMFSRKFPMWLNVLLGLFLVTGAAFCAFWLIKAALFLLRSVSAS